MIDNKDLKKYSDVHGLGFDDDDIKYYKNIFKNRKATRAELFDLAQSNSEHSRHWVFKGEFYDKNSIKPYSLFEMIKYTLTVAEKNGNNNSIIAFSDNSSSISGYKVNDLLYDYSELKKKECNKIPLEMNYKNQNIEYDITLTAETHNFPTGVSPFHGATTGTGGRIRDNQSIGRGGSIIAGSAGYSVGNLHLENQIYNDNSFTYNSLDCYHRPLTILIEASNGASDYGNKIGEPKSMVLRFGMRTKDNKNVNG